MRRTIFIIGGARSGKSRFAADLAKGIGRKVAFIATCNPKDEEMRRRIKNHKKARPAGWRVIVEEKDLSSALEKVSGCPVVIVDCLTLWLSNLLLREESGDDIAAKTKNFLHTASGINGTLIIVSNEVGHGIVPQNDLARRFRDICGAVNQLVARHSDEVYFVVAGIPMSVKNRDGGRRKWIS